MKTPAVRTTAERGILLVGLTGPFQHGKTELRPVIENAGWRFTDLNDFQNSLREPGTERYALYNRLMPGALDDAGGETEQYYRTITPELRNRLVAPEIPVVADMVNEFVSGLPDGSKVLLSWELWPAILDLVPIQHMLVLMQPRQRWSSRLQKRAIERGWEHLQLEGAAFDHLIRIMDAVPEKILAAVAAKMPQAHTVIDVSPEDWGAMQLLEVLNSFERVTA